jgi:hypothetical protein
MKTTYDAEADSGGAVFGIEFRDASEKLGFARRCPEVALKQMVFKGSPAR